MQTGNKKSVTNDYEGAHSLTPFETISFRGRVDVLDRDRQVAVFRRKQRIRFLENNVAVFFDRVWGEGVLFANYQAKGLRIIDAFQASKGYIVALSLPKRFKRGDVFDIETERRIVGAFYKDQGYWDSAMSAPTKLLSIDIVTPPGVGIRAPDIVAPTRDGIDADHQRQRLRLRAKGPQTHVSYSLRWAWR